MPLTDKTILRQAVRRQRAALNPLTCAAETMVTNTLAWEVIHRFAMDHLASYMAYGTELSLSVLHDRWWALNRPVWLPRVVSDHALTWHPIRSEMELHPGEYDILEPDASKVPAQPLPKGTLLLVPGVAFTVQGARLGQGKGYFDRVLAAPGIGPAIGIGFTCQLVDKIPLEPHDRPLHGVIIGGRWLPAH